MPNPLQAAWSFLRGDDLKAPLQEKVGPFTPANPGIDWQRVESLVYTASPFTPSFAATGDGNSAVFACLMAISLASIEPPLKVYRQQKVKREEAPADPLQSFLDNPNPWFDMLELRFWTAWARHLDGNAYLVKVRSGNPTAGIPIELWPVPPSRMRPYTERDSSDFISYYKLTTNGAPDQEIPVENVIHFKLGVDDQDVRKGLSPLKRLVREIASDAEATHFADALLKNFGIPGLVVNIPENSTLDENDARDLKAKIQNTYGSDQRGGVGVLTGGATMEQFGFNPRQLDLKVLHDVPETRICAVMGVPPSVANLGVGLEQTSNFASARQMTENFTEKKLKPMWKLDEAKWNKQLKPDFTDDPGLIIAHDLSEVSALQEDQDALYKRLDAAVKTGWVLPDEARSEVGLPPMPDGTGMEPLPKPVAPAALPGDEDSQEEQPQLPPGRGKGLDLKATDLDDWPEMMQALVNLAEPATTSDLDKFHEGQRKRVRRALLNGH